MACNVLDDYSPNLLKRCNVDNFILEDFVTDGCYTVLRKALV